MEKVARCWSKIIRLTTVCAPARAQWSDEYSPEMWLPNEGEGYQVPD